MPRFLAQRTSLIDTKVTVFFSQFTVRNSEIKPWAGFKTIQKPLMFASKFFFYKKWQKMGPTLISIFSNVSGTFISKQIVPVLAKSGGFSACCVMLRHVIDSPIIIISARYEFSILFSWQFSQKKSPMENFSQRSREILYFGKQPCQKNTFTNYCVLICNP